MKYELYGYGLTNALESIGELLASALETTNKNEKAKYISEAYGMVKAIDMLIIESEEELKNNI